MTKVTYLVSDLARTLRRVFNTRVRQLGMTGSQARLLLMLDANEGQNQGYYADLLEVEPITLCRLVDRMEESGLIERRPHPADRRARLIHLADRGRALIDGVRDELEAMEQQLSQGLDTAERTSLVRVLEKVRANYLAIQPSGESAHG